MSQVEQSPHNSGRYFNFNGIGLQFLKENSYFPLFFFTLCIRGNVITYTENRRVYICHSLMPRAVICSDVKQVKALPQEHSKNLHDCCGSSPKVPVRTRAPD